MANPNFDPDQMHFFYKNKYLGSCEPGDAWCPKLLELMKSDPAVASIILDYMNSLGDPVFPVSEEDWGTPETDISKVDIEDLYNTFLQELDYEYRDFPDDFYVGGDYRLPDFEIFVGEVADDVQACGDIKASSNYKLPDKKLVFSDGDSYEFHYTSEEGDVFEPKSGSGNWWTSYIVTPDNKLLSWQFSGRYTPVDAVYGEDFWVEDNSIEACGDIKASSTKYGADMCSITGTSGNLVYENCGDVNFADYGRLVAKDPDRENCYYVISCDPVYDTKEPQWSISENYIDLTDDWFDVSAIADFVGDANVADNPYELAMMVFEYYGSQNPYDDRLVSSAEGEQFLNSLNVNGEVYWGASV